MQRRAFELGQAEEGEPTLDVLAPDYPERLGEIAVPTLILVGELDRPEMHEIADRLESEIPNARRATIDAHRARSEHGAPARVRRARPRLPRGGSAMSSLEAVELVDRIWARDPSVWTGHDEAHWLGWLDEPGRMLARLDELEGLDRDFDDVVLLGMGGSSLGPEVIRRTFGITRLHVLDTTHPTAIRRLEQEVDLDRTLFVGASKSGSTLETRSQLDYFLERGKGTFGAITDPGTELEQFARDNDFAFVVNGEPTIGGRYSVLSPFGMVPAALLDLDVKMLLERAEAMAEWCRLGEENPGFMFGLQLGEGWSEGRDKVCIDETPGGFGLWAEQLIAESTGKQDKGLVPAPGEDPSAGPTASTESVRFDDPYDLGAEFFRWEFATAVAGSILGINPFDQPDVQAAKDRTSAISRRRRGQPRDEARRVTGRVARRRETAALHRNPGFHRPRARGRARRARPQGARDRLRRHEGPRPSLSALDGSAAQGRAEHDPRRPGRGRLRRGARDPRQGIRLPAADRGAGRGRPRGAQGARPALLPREAGRPHETRHGRPRADGLRDDGTAPPRRPRDHDLRPEGGVDRLVARRARHPARAAARRLDDDPVGRPHRGRLP